MEPIEKDPSKIRCVKKRKCLYHPAMECPSPGEPCIFKLIEDVQKGERNKAT